MFNIIKNVGKILLKRKGYLLVALVFPVIITLLFTSIYTSNSNYKVAIVNNDNGVLSKEIEKNLENLDMVEVKKLEENKDNINKLVFNEVSMIITIEDGYTEKLLKGEQGIIKYNTIGTNEMAKIIESILNQETISLAMLCNNIDFSKTTIEEVLSSYEKEVPKYDLLNNFEDKKVNVLATVGIIIYLIFISASMSAGLLLEDEREGTKDRILMGKISQKGYYGAMGTIFFILTAIPAIEYYIICKVLDYNIGFNNSIIFLILLLLIVLLAVSFSMMVSTLIKNKAVYAIVGGTLVIPVFMLSGAFWEFSMMSEALQKVGSIFPIRWFMLSVERLQQGMPLSSITLLVLGLILIIILFFLLSIFFSKNKIILVKEN